jgi:hypothetical protein
VASAAPVPVAAPYILLLNYHIVCSRSIFLLDCSTRLPKETEIKIISVIFGDETSVMVLPPYREFTSVDTSCT